jgi:uncharacterized membrane protein YjjP (DUF1212 family)
MSDFFETANEKPHDVLRVSLKAGEILLCNGAETYRVEETIMRLCAAYGYTSDAFVLPTGIFISVSDGEKSESIVRRITSRSVNLQRVSAVNAFSRQTEARPRPTEEALQSLEAISQLPSYPTWIVSSCYILTAFVFTILFGGNWMDSFIALGIGSVLAFLRFSIIRHTTYPFVEFFVGGFSAGLLSQASSLILPNLNTWLVVIGALINFMPGVALVNGVRDLLNGDNVSGITKLSEALVTVFVVAAGAGIGASAIVFLGFNK